MPQKVKGYLASDGSFFEDEPECKRYEAQQRLITLCETHNISPENFFALLRSWHEHIREWYDADSQCKSKQANGAEPTFEQPEAVPQDDEDTPYLKRRDKDAPGFLEQSFGGDK